MGGSIRVYAAYDREPDESVKAMLEEEKSLSEEGFAEKVESVRETLRAVVPASAWGIGAPSRATTLINHTGIDLDAVCEIAGSDKIGKVIPGTTIPVVDEQMLFDRQPAYALILSWHIASEVMANLRRKGYRGKFIIPLPTPMILEEGPHD